MKLSSIAIFAGTVGLACAGGALIPPAAGVGFAAFVAGGLLQGMAGNYATEFANDIRARFATRYIEGFSGLDANHHVALALRRAQLRATIELVQNSQRNAPENLSQADRDFAGALHRWCRVQQSETELTAWVGRQAAEEAASKRLQSAFEAAYAADRHASLDALAVEARQALEAVVLAELAAAGNAVEPPGLMVRLLGRKKVATQGVTGVPAGFGAAFRGDDSAGSGWFGIFMRAVGVELKRPDSPFRDLWQSAQLAGISALLSTVAEQVGATAADIDAMRSDLSKLLESQMTLLARVRAEGAPVLYLPEGSEAGHLSFARFFYRSRWTEFVGRGSEMAWLEASCLEKARGLRLSLVTGPGGHGKSRLALEHGWHMHLGHGWDAGFLDHSSEARWEHWQPERPTLILVDYSAGRVETIRRIVHALGKRNDLQFPVHILLLERYGDMAAAFTQRSGARTWCHRLTEGGDVDLVSRHWGGQLSLQSEPAENVLFRALAIMLDTFAAKGVEPQWSMEGLVAQLFMIDRSLSPLFAMLVADALAEGKEISADSRYEFLISTLERSQIWRDDDASSRPQTVRSLVALATLIRGVDLPVLKQTLAALDAEGFDTSQFRPDAGAEWGPLLDACSRLTGRTGDARFYGLEPDLLGEALILHHCDPADPDGPERANRLHRVGWAIPSDGMGGFHAIVEMLALMAQDFGSRAFSSSLYDPPEAGTWAMVRSYFVISTILSNFASEFAFEIYEDANAAFDMSRATEEVLHARAIAAFNLFNDLRQTIGYKEAMPFYDTQLVAPAEGERAFDALKIERARAANNLCTDIFLAEGREVGLAFYNEHLVIPAEMPGTHERVREARANAAFNLCLSIRQEVGLQEARDFYNEFVIGQIPPVAGCNRWVARALGTLLSGVDAQPDREVARSLLDNELPRLMEQWDKPYPFLIQLVGLIETWLTGDDPFVWPEEEVEPDEEDLTEGYI